MNLDKRLTRTCFVGDVIGKGALLEFLAIGKSSLSIWHPVCTSGAPLKRKLECYDLQKFHDRAQVENTIIFPINAEIVQIKSQFGHVTRAVSPRNHSKNLENVLLKKIFFSVLQQKLLFEI